MPNPVILKIEGVGEGGTLLPNSTLRHPTQTSWREFIFEANAGQAGGLLALRWRGAIGRFLFHLPNPLWQKWPLWSLLGQLQRLLIRRPSLSCPAEPAAHICTGGMRQVIICQFAMLQHRVDMCQACFWTVAHGNGHGTIELYNGRRLNSLQSVVERNNLPPVGRSDRFRVRMNGRNCSLQCVGAEAAGLLLGLQGFLQQRHSLRDLLPVPERAVLILQQNQLSGRRGSGGVTGFL